MVSPILFFSSSKRQRSQTKVLYTADVCVCLSVIQSFNLFFHFSGLSREGWYIVKNLLTEMTVLLAGFFTFVPAVQVNALAFFPSNLRSFLCISVPLSSV